MLLPLSQKIKIAHPVDPDVPEGQELALAPRHTHEKSDPGQDTGDAHPRDHGRRSMTRVGLVGDVLVPEKGNTAGVDLIPGTEGRTRTVKLGRAMTGMKRGRGTKREGRLPKATLAPDVPAVQAEGIRKVDLDPGHQSGAPGRHHHQKEARKTKREIKDGTVAGKGWRFQHPGGKAGTLTTNLNPH